MFAKFVANCRGGVAPMVGFAALPLMVAVGIAVDYTRASSAKSSFQAALDSAALMLHSTAPTQSAADIQTSATNYVSALFHYPNAENLAINAQYSSAGGSTVTLTGSVTVPTQFMRLIGYDTLNIGAKSVSTWGDVRLRVALVLDNTGSMADAGKMTALKTAAHNLLNQLKNATSTSEDVYVSIIPFSKDVNFGSTNVSANWLRWDLWDETNGACSKTKYNSKTACTANGHSWTPTNHSHWNGCVTDRDQNFDTTNSPPVAGATLYPTEQYAYCSTALVGLSNNWAVLSSEIDAMQPNGNTNQAIGLQVGWQSLTGAPFTIPTLDPNYKYMQVVILLTDGLNTQDRWYTSQTSIDARQEKTCDNVKAAGVTIYAVQVNTGGDPTSSLLQYCASDSSKFFLLTSANGIVATFNQIGTALTQLRLSM